MSSSGEWPRHPHSDDERDAGRDPRAALEPPPELPRAPLTGIPALGPVIPPTPTPTHTPARPRRSWSRALRRWLTGEAYEGLTLGAGARRATRKRKARHAPPRPLDGPGMGMAPIPETGAKAETEAEAEAETKIRTGIAPEPIRPQPPPLSPTPSAPIPAAAPPPGPVPTPIPIPIPAVPARSARPRRKTSIGRFLARWFDPARADVAGSRNSRKAARAALDPRAWWRTLRRVPGKRRLVLGAPAALAVACGLAAIPWIWPERPETLAARLRVRGAIALRAIKPDPGRAILAHTRLILLDPDDAAARWGLVRGLEYAGDPDAAYDAALKLARDDPERDHPEARLWMAKHLLRTPETPGNLGLAREHLERALAVRPRADFGAAPLRVIHAEANALLGRLDAEAGDHVSAIARVEGAVVEFPEFHVTLADLAERLGDARRARSSLERARDWYAAETRRVPTNLLLRRNLAEIHLRLGEIDDAERVLADALRLDPGDGNLRDVAARLVALRLDRLPETSGANANADPDADAERRRLLAVGLALQPASAPLLDRLHDWLNARLRPDAPLDPAATDGGPGPEIGLARLVWTLDAWREGRPEPARLRWTRAVEAFPTLPVVVRNLALRRARVAPGQPDEPLLLLDLLIDRNPDLAALRVDRARVLLDARRPGEALRELEHPAVRKLEPQPPEVQKLRQRALDEAPPEP